MTISLVGRIAAHGDHRAIVAGGQLFTYRDLEAASRGAASRLLSDRDDLAEARVAFLIAPSFDYVSTLMGIWRAGGIAVPLAVSHPAAELDYVIRDAGAEIVVADSTFAETVASLAKDAGACFFLARGGRLEPTHGRGPQRGSRAGADGRVPQRGSRDGEEGRGGEDSPEGGHQDGYEMPPVLTPSRRALILYTSGTTGKPKGVVTTHANLEAQITSLITAWEWTAADRALLVLPLHHVHGVVNVLGTTLWAGATCEIAPRFEAEATWDRLASGELTVFTAVPTVYQKLIASWEAAPPSVRRARSEGCRRLRLMMSGSAALPVQMLERWRVISGHTLLERYGMTEIAMALSNPLHGERRPGFVGTPLPGVVVRLVDEHGSEVSPGASGELEVRGPAVFLEYWRRPEDTQHAFRDGWFQTGDVATMDEGSYRLLGRMSIDIIKTGGYKVSALEIESVLRDHPAVAQCAVVGIADEMWGEKICVAIELGSAGDLTLQDLQEWARMRLAPYKIPKELRSVDALPRNAMGKVVKPQVAALFGASSPRTKS